MKVLLTVGATREIIDPVRYISNQSSGRMGMALAQAFIDKQCEVWVVHAYSEVGLPKGCHGTFAKSSRDMHRSVLQSIDAVQPNCFVACAAVSDFIPVESTQKLKKHLGLQLQFDLAPDILADVAQRYPHVFTVGFAAESEHLLWHAEQKRLKKQVDVMVANDVKYMGAEQNALTIITESTQTPLEPMAKDKAAEYLVDWLIRYGLKNT